LHEIVEARRCVPDNRAGGKIVLEHGFHRREKDLTSALPSGEGMIHLANPT
jgi:hypothetical protein